MSDLHLDIKREEREKRIFKLFWQKRVSELYNIQTMLKDQLEAFEILKDNVIVKMCDGRKFFWDYKIIDDLGSLIEKGSIERSERNILEKLIAKKMCVFDIGANFGWYSTLFGILVGNHGKVHSFEPVEPTFHKLKNNIELNNLNSRTIIPRMG